MPDYCKYMDIYVGNMAYEMGDDDLREAFVAFGEVESARVLMDRDTGRSRGFGFVKMPDPEAGNRAIEQMNGAEVMGRPLKVREAEERPERSGGGGGFQRGGGGGGFNQRSDRSGGGFRKKGGGDFRGGAPRGGGDRRDFRRGGDR